MKIIVVGCGKIGTTIISSLTAEGHDVVAIDNDISAISEITNIYDIMCVCGSGTDYDTLSEAGVDSAELYIAVTGSDELNMLGCYLAEKMGAKHTIARIRNSEYNDNGLGFIKQQLGISMSINPEQLAAKELFNLLRLPGATNIETFSGRTFEIAELKLRDDSPLCNLKLMDVRKKYRAKFLITAVQRGDEVYIPDGNFELKSGDKIGLTASPSEIHKLLKMMGLTSKSTKDVMILGASRTAIYLGKMLVHSGNSVKVVEIDKDKCMEFSDKIPEATVILGDGTSQELLLEENIASTDAFVALTGMDEENILMSIFASLHSRAKVISKVNREELLKLAEQLGLDCIVSPKKIISNIILRYVRALQNTMGSDIETLYRLMDGSVEALEFNVHEEFSHCQVPLKEMKTKKNVLIAGIIRGRRSFIPSGDDMILPNDRVVVFAAGQRINSLSDILD